MKPFPPVRIHVGERDMQTLKKNTRAVQFTVRFSQSNPNATAMRNKISMAQMENKDYRDATAKSPNEMLRAFLLLLVLRSATALPRNGQRNDEQ